MWLWTHEAIGMAPTLHNINTFFLNRQKHKTEADNSISKSLFTEIARIFDRWEQIQSKFGFQESLSQNQTSFLTWAM